MGGLSSGLPRPGVDTPGPNLPSFLPGAPESGERTGRTSTSPEAAASDTRGPQPGEAPGEEAGEAEDKGHQGDGGTGGGVRPSLGGGGAQKDPEQRGTPRQPRGPEVGHHGAGRNLSREGGLDRD